MDSRKRLILLVVATAAAVLLGGGVAAAQDCGPTHPPSNPWLVAAGQYKPQAWGDTLVYGRYVDGACQVVARDLVTGDVEPVSPDSGLQWDPDIHEDRIVWEDHSGPDVDIVVFDRATGTERRIERPGHQYSPAIWDDTLVYEDFFGRRMHLVVHDLESDEARRLPVGPLTAPKPDIYADQIVYCAGGDIRLYDLSMEADRLAVDGPGWLDTPSIFGDSIVYARWDTGGKDTGLADIRRADLSNGADVLLVADVGCQYSPCVWPEGVAYEDYPNVGGPRIDLLRPEEPITDAAADEPGRGDVRHAKELRSLTGTPRLRAESSGLPAGFAHVCEPHALPAARWSLASPAG